MALIGTLNVGLKASTARFAKDMKAAKAVTRDFTTGIFSLKNAVIGLAATMATSAVVGKFMERMEKLDALKKFSDLIGADVVALQVLDIEGRKAGISGEALQKAMRSMTDSVAEAMTGTGAAAEAYKILRLNLRDLFKLSPDQMFLKVGEAMKKVENPTARLNAGVAIFTKRGIQAVELAESMSTGFDDAKKSALGLNLAFNAIELSRVEGANDAIRTMQTKLTGVVDQLAVKLSPAITFAADKFTEWLTAVPIIDRMRAGLVAVEGTIDLIANAVASIRSSFDFAAAGAGKLLSVLVIGYAKLDYLKNRLDLSMSKEDAKSMADREYEKFAIFAETLSQESDKLLDTAMTNLNDRMEAAAGGIGRKAVGGVLQTLEELTAEIDAVNKKIVEAREKRNEAGRTDDAFAKQQAAILEAQGKGVDIGGIFVDFWKDAIGAGAKMLGGHVDSIIDGLMFKEERKAPTLAQEFNSALVDIAALSTVGGAKDPQLLIAEKQLEELKKITKNPVEFIAKMVK